MRFKTKVLAGTSVLMVALGTTALAATNASAKLVFVGTIVPGPGSSISCTLKGKAFLTPTLKADWLKSEHTTDLDATVRALPDTQFATAADITHTDATGKGKCTGTVTDGVKSASVTKVSFAATSDSANSVSPTFGVKEATCGGLATQGGDTTFQTTLTLTSKTATIPPITMTSTLSNLFDSHGVGFDLTAVSAAGTTGAVDGETIAYVDGKTVSAILSAPPTSALPKPVSSCEPTIKFKKGVAFLKTPKGFGKIKIGGGAFDGTPSEISLTLS